MNDFVLAEAKQVERRLRECVDPALRLVWAPKIQRFVICSDRLISRRHSTPWELRDPDLEGAQGVEWMTSLEALRRLEDSAGGYIPPVYELIVAIVASECPRAGDRDPMQFGSMAVKRRYDKIRDKAREFAQDVRKAKEKAARGTTYSYPKV